MSPDSGFNELHGLTPEEQERQRQEWQQELAKVYILCLITSCGGSGCGGSGCGGGGGDSCSSELFNSLSAT